MSVHFVYSTLALYIWFIFDMSGILFPERLPLAELQN